MALEALVLGQRSLRRAGRAASLVFVPEAIGAVGAVGHTRQLEADLGEDVDVVGVRQVEVVPEGGRVDVAVPQLRAQLLTAVLVDPDPQQLVEARWWLTSRMNSRDCSGYSSNGILRPSARQT